MLSSQKKTIWILACSIPLLLFASSLLYLKIKKQAQLKHSEKFPEPVQITTNQNNDKNLSDINNSYLSSSDPMFSDLLEHTTNDLMYNYEEREIEEKSKFGQTKTAFNKIFNTPNIESQKILDFIFKSDDQEKAWICEQIVNRFFTDPDSVVQRTCLLSLPVHIFNKESRKLVVEALSSDDDNVRRTAAIIARSPYFTENELDALYQAIKEDTPEFHPRTIAQNAIMAIGIIGGQKASGILKELWENEKSCKNEILHAFGFINDMESFKICESVARNDEDVYQPAALFSLEMMAIFNAPNLTTSPRENQIKNQEIYEKARSYFKDQITNENEAIRGLTARAFGDFGTKDDIKLLEPMLNDSYSKVVIIIENDIAAEKTIFPVREEAEKAISKILER